MRAAALLAAALLLAGCGTAAHADNVVRSLGAVPIPTAAPGVPTPTAAVGHPQLVAMGSAVRVRLAGADALVTALGPTQAGTAGTSTPATIDVRVRCLSGDLAVSAGEFSSRDETGRAVPITAAGPATVHAAAGGGTGTLRLAARYDSGSAQLTWRHDGHVLAIWDFTIELD